MRSVKSIHAAEASLISIFALGVIISTVFIAELNTARLDAVPAFLGETRYVFMALMLLLLGLLAVTAHLVWRNTREKNKLVEERAQFVAIQQAAFDSASDAYVLVSPTGAIERINRAAERMFGRGRDTLKNTDVGVLLEIGGAGGNLLERLGASSEELAAGMVRETLGRRADGAGFNIEIALRKIAISKDGLLGVVVRDISDRKRVERLKDEFVSTVNHELRTPLTSIAGSLGLLEGGAAGELPANAARLIAIAHANCQRLIRLINDMLDVEKIESGKMRFDMAPIALSDVIRRSMDSVVGLAGQFGVRLDAFVEKDEISVRGDGDRLVQVITNLLSNALKFSRPSGTVRVSVARVGRLARLSVRDDGPGIPDEFRARIFTKFAQADSSDARRRGGTGLGLVIAKEIVDRHGGRLWFESEVGRGACFFVDLPLLEPARAPGATRTGTALLVCEDDPDAAMILCEALERDGYAVDLAATLGDAEDALARVGHYQALILDLIMPDGDGVAFIRRLRARTETRSLPIIVVSARAHSGRAEPGSTALNVVDWMEKPVDLGRLNHAVQVAVARATAPKPLILHVEDDPDILEVTASALRGLGEVVPALTLVAAREALAKQKPSLVILDLSLADGSGLDLLPEIGHAPGSAVPVLIFSARDTDELIVENVSAAMTKSRTSLGQLAETVKRLLEQSPAPEAAKERLVS